MSAINKKEQIVRFLHEVENHSDEEVHCLESANKFGMVNSVSLFKVPGLIKDFDLWAKASTVAFCCMRILAI